MKKKLLLQDLAELLAANEEIGKKEADTFVRSFFDIIEQGLLEDKFVKIKGLGTFKLVAVSERESVNVNTGERIQINGHTKVTFTPDTSMKELVNRPFAHFEAVDLSDDTDMAEFEAVDAHAALDVQEEDEPEDLTNNNDTDEEAEELETENEVEDVEGEETETETADTEEDETAIEVNETVVADTTSETDAAEVAGADQKQVRTAQEEQVATSETEETPSKAEIPETALNDAEDKSVTTEDEQAAISQPTDIAEETSLADEDKEGKTEIPNATAAPQNAESETAEVKGENTNVKSETTEAESATIDEHEENGNFAEEEPEHREPNTEQVCEEPTVSPNDKTDADKVVTTSQNLTSQGDTSNSTPLTTSNIQYEYTEVPMPRKRNWWKIGLISLSALLIMFGCYFAGYFRLLCPPCQFPILEGVFIPANVQQTPSNSESSKPGAQASPTVDNDKHHNPTLAKPSTPQPQATHPEGKDTKAEVKTSNKQPASPSAKGDASTEKGKPAKHVVRPGDTLLNISRRYYGSEGYVKAIMNLNHLKDSNNIAVGLVLRLP